MDSIQLQRLVDGELGFDEAQRLMRDADQSPESWRLIASTFVENQLWQSEFTERHGLDLRADATAVRNNRPTRTSAARINTRQIWWMSLAASVALALSIGFLAGKNEFGSDFGSGQATNNPNAIAGLQQNAQPEFDADNTQVTSARDNAYGHDLNLNPAVYHHMQLEDPKGNQLMDSEIPLYPVTQNNDLRRLWRSEIPASTHHQLRESGYQVQQDIRYVSGRFDDGRQFVIPIRNYRFSPNQ